jgi:hypothetical protein
VEGPVVLLVAVDAGALVGADCDEDGGDERADAECGSYDGPNPERGDDGLRLTARAHVLGLATPVAGADGAIHDPVNGAQALGRANNCARINPTGGALPVGSRLGVCRVAGGVVNAHLVDHEVRQGELVIRLCALDGHPVNGPAPPERSDDIPPRDPTEGRVRRHQGTLGRWQPENWYRPRSDAVGLVEGCASVDPSITDRERAWINERVRVTGGMSTLRLSRVGAFRYMLVTDATRTIECGGSTFLVRSGSRLLVCVEIGVPFTTRELPL